MAKQKSQHPFTGKMGGTIGYKSNGEYLERENGNKEGKRFRRDPKRKRTMEYARTFGRASKGLKPLYYKLPKEQRRHGVFGALIGKAASLMYTGKTMEEVLPLFQQWFLVEGRPVLEERGQAGAVVAGAGAAKEAGRQGTERQEAAGSGAAISGPAAASKAGVEVPVSIAAGNGTQKAAVQGAGVDAREKAQQAQVPALCDSASQARDRQTWPSMPWRNDWPPQVPCYVIATVQAPVYWRSA